MPAALPAMTSFVGRRDELAALDERLSRSRLVTLVGPGGVGKTRLALRAAERHRRALPDGVWVVDLGSTSREERVAGAVLLALGVRDQSARSAEEQLLHHVAGRHLLLVLDNCEHLLDEVARLTHAMLVTSAQLRILATSREALGVAGEHLLVVEPLPVPDPEQGMTVAALKRYEAVALLLDRVRGVRPAFTVDEGNRQAVARLCSELDGIPLAIELAAGRLRTMSLTQVVDRLDDRFRLLSGGPAGAAPRQQTLGALVDWSHELCTEDEQLLWARLSIFPASFDLSAAEAVCSGGRLKRSTLVDLLDHLVAKSIVSVEQRSETVRFRLLSTMRQYGAQRLDPGALEGLGRRHRDTYLERARGLAAAWFGPGQASALAEFRVDYPNLRAALEWSIDHVDERSSALSLVTALRYYWVAGGFLGAGRRWLDLVLGMADGPDEERTEALLVAGWVCCLQGDRAAAAARLDEAAQLAAGLDEPTLQVQVAGWGGLAALFTGDVEAAVALYAPAVERLMSEGDDAAALTLMFQLSVAEAYCGRLDEAAATCERAIAHATARGERWNRSYALWVSGLVAWRSGDLAAAGAATRAALTMSREFEDAIATALMVELLAWTVGAAGRQRRAATLLGAADAIWLQIGTGIEAFAPQMAAESHACREAALQVLGPKEHAEALREASSLSVDDVIGLALAEDRRPAAIDADLAPLTRREQQVAVLVAEGRRNREIAESLVLSVRTIDSHVERIMGKLGVHSRAQVAVWVAARGPVGAAVG